MHLKDKYQLWKTLRKKRFQRGKVNLAEGIFEFPDSHSFVNMYHEIFGEEVYNFSTKSSSPFIIDVGANIGLASLFFKKVYPDSEILAFEADPEIAAYFEKNMAINNKNNNVTLIQKAVWNKKTNVIFHKEGSWGGSIINDHGKGNVEVETVILSQYINKDVDLLKLDIEGDEDKIIEEIQDNLHFIKNIALEFHSFADRPQRLQELLSVLGKHGFRYHLKEAYYRKSPLTNWIYEKMDSQIEIFAKKI